MIQLANMITTASQRIGGDVLVHDGPCSNSYRTPALMCPVSHWNGRHALSGEMTAGHVCPFAGTPRGESSCCACFAR